MGFLARLCWLFQQVHQVGRACVILPFTVKGLKRVEFRRAYEQIKLCCARAPPSSLFRKPRLGRQVKILSTQLIILWLGSHFQLSCCTDSGTRRHLASTLARDHQPAADDVRLRESADPKTSIFWLPLRHRLGSEGQAYSGRGAAGDLTMMGSMQPGSGRPPLTLEDHTDLLFTDRARLTGRRLQQDGTDTEFLLQGNADPQLAGLYYTTVQLGTPPQEFNVQIDTGSDLLWVACQPCLSCASASNISALHSPFNRAESSTNQVLSCGSDTCPLFGVVDNVVRGCAEESGTQNCYYLLQYADSSSSFGLLMTDVLHLNSVGGNTSTVTFGCGFNQSGNLVHGGQTVDGVLGLGLGTSSLLTQLAVQKRVPNAFAHCLAGREGGGALLLGRVEAEGMQYTPLVESPRGTQYFADLQGMSLDGVDLNIPPDAFGSPARGGGTIFDSGTSLAFLVGPAYIAFTTAVSEMVSLPQLEMAQTGGRFCYDFASNPFPPFTRPRLWSSVRHLFPTATLHFAGGAAMELAPENYILLLSAGANREVACIAWDSSAGSLGTYSVLGDLALRNVLMEFDRDNWRIGWKSTNCSTWQPSPGAPLASTILTRGVSNDSSDAPWLTPNFQEDQPLFEGETGPPGSSDISSGSSDTRPTFPPDSGDFWIQSRSPADIFSAAHSSGTQRNCRGTSPRTILALCLALLCLAGLMQA